jgi:hypothetical protein
MEAFLSGFRAISYYGAFVTAGAGLLIFLYVIGKLVTTRDYKKKYDFVSKYEKDALWYGCLAFIIAGGLYATSILSTEFLHLFVGLFVSGMFGLIVGVIIYNYLKFYYPSFLEERLNKLRYSPRISPKTGKPMKLLSEDEEDVYLDEGMQAEENIFSVDYDVWIDEESGYSKIEKYPGHIQALKSPTCGYYTLRVVREEIIESPTEDKEGTLVKYYECSYTGYKTQKVFNIAPLKKIPKSQKDTITTL